MTSLHILKIDIEGKQKHRKKKKKAPCGANFKNIVHISIYLSKE